MRHGQLVSAGSLSLGLPEASGFPWERAPLLAESLPSLFTKNGGLV